MEGISFADLLFVFDAIVCGLIGISILLIREAAPLLIDESMENPAYRDMRSIIAMCFISLSAMLVFVGFASDDQYIKNSLSLARAISLLVFDTFLLKLIASRRYRNSALILYVAIFTVLAVFYMSNSYK